jgi:hypothetical protein
MESKLFEFQMKNKDLDTSKPQANIDYLKQIQIKFHYLWHENYKQLQLTGSELLEKQRLLNRITQLEREVKILKENII